MALLVLSVLCFLLPALAEGGPVNPERMTVLTQSQIFAGDAERALSLSRRIALLAAPESGEEDDPPLAMTITRKSAPSYTTAGSWSVSVNKPGNWRFAFYFGETSSVFGSSWVIHRKSQSTSAAYTSCPLVVPGEYRLLVNLYDADVSLKKPVLQNVVYYTIAEDASHPPLESYIADIVASCRGESDFDTALALHDWLTHHAYYDHSLSYYGADGVLVRGYGTCDSYSKAYWLLLNAAGIGVTRISGNNHAWNALCLEDAWYQCDTTWDDISATTCHSAVSGGESHEYFCLTDELMLDEHDYTPAADTLCESLDMNYFVRLGGWEAWDTGFVDALHGAVSQGRQAFAVSLGNVAPIEFNRHMTILCWALNTKPEAFAADFPGEELTFVYDRASVRIAVARTAGRAIADPWLYAAEDGGAVVYGYLGVPGGLTVPDTIADLPVTGLGARAFFLETRLTSLTLPDTAASVGAEALAGCSALTSLSMPAALSEIGAEALPGGWVTDCAADTALARALGAAGYDFADPAYPDWRLRWADGCLAAAACLSAEPMVTLPAEIGGVLGLGADAGVQVLELPSGTLWLDGAMAVPADLWLVIAEDVPQALEDWAQAADVTVLDRSRRAVLPAGLTVLEAGSLSGTAVCWPVLPAGITAVGEGAFADCPFLAAVTFPAGEIVLPDSLFGEADPVVLAPAGSAAALWAVSHGYRVLMY